MLFRWLFGGLVPLALAASAQAGLIQDHIDGLDSSQAYFDFRNAAIYGACDRQNSCTEQEANAGDRSVTISAGLKASGRARLLYRDNKDGFGIRGHEGDEIDADEVLTVLFDGGWQATVLGLTDLFMAGDGGSDGEEAIVRGYRDDTLVYELRFEGQFAPGKGNGEGVFVLPGIAVDLLEFHSVEDPDLTFTDLEGVNVGQRNDEYSVAYIEGTPVPQIFTTTTNAVPEPGLLGLFGCALLGLGLMGRRRA
jgi:hypothetical protein